MKTKVTKLEMQILNEVEGWDLNDGTQDVFYAPIYHVIFDMKVYRGVIASLVKKGIVSDVSDTAFNSSDMTELSIAKEYTAIAEDGTFEVTNLEVA